MIRVTLVTLPLCTVPALVAPQSLGDAARQQARKRSPRPPAKTYTDADLHTRADGSERAAPVETTSPREPPDAVLAASPSRADLEATVRAALDRDAVERSRQEASWRQKAAAALARLAAAHRAYDAACGPGIPGG
jgi:hypothetical protein